MYAPHTSVQKWIDEELVGAPCEVALMESLDEAVDAIVQRDRCRKIFVVDVDPLDADDLATIEAAWERDAVVVGLGHVPGDLRVSLSMMYVVPRPFGSEKLRAIISAVCDTADTVETTIA